MDHDSLEEQQIAERYVMGNLSTEETERFEEHYLTCEECMDRLHLAERFHLAMRGMAAEDTSRATGAGILATLVRMAGWQRTLLAVGLILAIAVPTMQWVRLASELQQSGGPQSLSTLLALSPVRSSSHHEEPVAQLTLFRKGEQVALSLDVVGMVSAGALRIALLDPEGTILWQSSPTSPDTTGRLLLSLPSDLLRAGDHEVRLVAVASGEPLGSPYRFRVIRDTE
jgi:hypothetical protein